MTGQIYPVLSFTKHLDHDKNQINQERLILPDGTLNNPPEDPIYEYKLSVDPSPVIRFRRDIIILQIREKMVYSTPYIGNYVCIILVMLETFLINGVYIGWSVLTVRDSYTTSFIVCHF